MFLPLEGEARREFDRPGHLPDRERAVRTHDALGQRDDGDAVGDLHDEGDRAEALFHAALLVGRVIRRIETDTASRHDSKHFDNVFETNNTCRDVYVDRGYPSEEREARLKENGSRNQTQRKSKRNKPLPECQRGRNKRIAKTRARVEHVFGVLEHMGGKLLRTIVRREQALR